MERIKTLLKLELELEPLRPAIIQQRDMAAKTNRYFL